MEHSVEFVKATPDDAADLARASQRAFEDDVNYGAPGPGGPPGYDSPEWQTRFMYLATYYKIVADGQVIGGFIVREEANGRGMFMRAFIVPDFQNRGIGTHVMQFIESAYPGVDRWTLDTPEWNLRTQHFYEKNGYVKVGPGGTEGIMYQKIVSRDG